MLKGEYAAGIGRAIREVGRSHLTIGHANIDLLVITGIVPLGQGIGIIAIGRRLIPERVILIQQVD
ncbi:MAG: hypothetical protein R3E89_09835 [Thiolinea sp.]